MRNHRLKYSILSVTIVLSISGHAQLMQIKTTIDTNRIVLGDQIGLHYNIEKEKEILLKLPVFKDTLTAGVEIIGTPTIDSTKTKTDKMAISLDLLITAFDTGIYYIPPQPFIFRDGIYIDTAFSRAAYLVVMGVAIDSTQTIRDIKGQEQAPISPWVIAAIVLGSLLVLGLAGYLIYYFFIKKKDEEQEMRIQTKPSEPAYIAALRELDRIKAQKLWQQHQVKEYYTRITYTIRWYISQRFGIPALEETSDEILANFRKLSFDHANMQYLESLLTLADLVKFAKGNPDPDENIVHLDNAYDFVKKTKDEFSGQQESLASGNREPVREDKKVQED
jgi:hypothetical protein